MSSPETFRHRLRLAWSAGLAVYLFAMVTQLPTWFGVFVPQQSVMAIGLAAAGALIFLVPRGGDGGARRMTLGAIDVALWATLVFACGFIVLRNDILQDYGFFGRVDTTGMVIAVCLAVPVLEMARRKVGWPLVAIILAFVAIAAFQQFLPGILHGQPRRPERLLYAVLVADTGVFGKPLSIAVTIAIVFLVFGALMERAGAGQWFIDIALALTGRSRGGPAKAAVAASALFGSISGSPGGNSATTGSVTIPMMIRAGFRPTFAAAVEAVASTGGMILPPVMGAIAFLMAEWIGVRYVDVVAAATIPAVLYFVVVFASVHFEARRSGVPAMATDDLPRLLPTLARGWRYALPAAILVWSLLFEAMPPPIAGVYACLGIVAASFLTTDRTLWLLPGPIVEALGDAVRRWLVVLAVTAAVGIMIGALELSGVGLNMSRFVVDLGGGNVVVTLVLVGIASFIVGMGLDATPAYVTLAALMAPALIQLGISPVAAHLFVIFWGLASFFTPPTCLAVFITAPLAGAPVWATGWEATRLGIAAFIIPIAFALNPALLAMGTVPQIAVATVTALAGAVALAAGLSGFALRRLGRIERIVLCLAGAMLIAPAWTVSAVGAILAGAAAFRPTRASPVAGTTSSE